MKWLGVVCLSVIVSLATVRTASAELLYETINDIQVPTNVTWGTQIEWQGHAITKVTKQGDQYVVEVARDSEPHELPYFSVSFDSNWNYLGTVRTFNPAVERRMQEEAKRQQEEAQRAQQAEQDRIRQEQERERNKPKPEQPVAPKPEEPELPESPDDDDNGRGNDE